MKPFLIAIASLATGAALMSATQQPVTRREPQFENDRVKVWKSIIQPKQPLTLHRHEHGRALIALTNGTLSVVDKDGKTLDTYHWEAGKAKPRAKQSHGGGLDEIDENRSDRRHPETSKNRAGLCLLLEVRLDCARYSDRAEQKRDEANQIQEPI